MAFRGKPLAAGQFTNSITTLYSVPDGSTAYVKFFHLHNINVIEDTVEIYASKSGDLINYPIGRVTLVTNESADAVDKDMSLVLTEGDSIKARTLSSVSGITYFITGGLET